jgi:sigma-54 dependent transcriptional regulator, acetoin dehydrogenase operon transcriptional activator AcoR
MKPDAVRQAREALMQSGLRGSVGPGNVVPEAIERSWRRSISLSIEPSAPVPEQYEIDPETALCLAAAPVLDRWQQQLSGTPISLFLSDRAGRIVARRIGEKSHRPRLDRVYAAEGFDFSENSIGTNGLGTALVEGCPIFVEGSQHFSEFLAPLTCAAVPVMAPGGLAVGSFSMGVEVEAANALMLPLSKEIGHQIEQRLRSQTRPEDLALAMSFMRYKNSRRPTVVLDGQSMLANTPGVPYVSVDTHLILWELLRQHDWRRSDPAEIQLPTGAIAVARRVTEASERQYLVHFVIPESAAAPKPPTQRAEKLDISDTAVATEPGLGERALFVIDGPPGSGRLTRAMEGRAGDETTDPMVVVADPSDGECLADIDRTLSDGCDVILRRVEDLDERWADELDRLARRHHERVLRGDRDSTLFVTVCTTLAPARIRSILMSAGQLERIPPLASTPQRIPGLVRSILEELDQQHRYTMTPAALQAFLEWHWPGDVRELRQTLGAVLREARATLIERRHLPAHLRQAVPRRTLTPIEAAEREAIVRALEQSEGNKSAAAELLGIGRTTLYRRLRELRIDADESSL